MIATIANQNRDDSDDMGQTQGGSDQDSGSSSRNG